MKHYVTIGLAGHVDHGKTSFVKQIIATKAFTCQQNREPVQIREILHKGNPPCHEEDLASFGS